MCERTHCILYVPGDTLRVHQDALGCTWMHLDALGCTRVYQDALGCTWMHQDVLGCTRMHQDALGCTRMHWDALECTRMQQAALGCTGMHQNAFRVLFWVVETIMAIFRALHGARNHHGPTQGRSWLQRQSWPYVATQSKTLKAWVRNPKYGHECFYHPKENPKGMGE